MKRKLTTDTIFISAKSLLSTFLVLGALLFYPTPQLWAQCNSGGGVCGSAQPTCLPLSGTLPNGNNNSGAIPGCGGGFSFHNTSWFQITANSATIGINIVPTSCPNGLGIQAGLYTDCNPNSPPVDAVQCSCTTGGVSFSGNVVPGQNYYIMIDGCSGDVCEYEISLAGGEITCDNSALGVPDPPIPDINPVCPGLVVTFTIPAVVGASNYLWNFPPGVVPLDINCNTAVVIWGSNPGNVTVTAVNDGNPVGFTSLPTFMDVPSFEGFDGGEYCFPDEPGWLHPGTGTFFPGGNFDLNLQTANGCDSVVRISVIERTSTPNIVFEQICEGGQTCPIGGGNGAMPIVFNSETNGVPLTIPNASLYGCDSTLIVSVEVLAPTINIMEPDTLDCTNETTGVTIIADFDPNSDYLWTAGPGGNIIGPDDQSSVDVDQPGWYFLFQIVNGTTSDVCGFPPICFVEDSVLVVSNFDFPTVATSGDDLSCFGAADGNVTASVSGGVGPFSYVWSSDPANDTSPTVTGLDAGTYTVTVTGSNGCEAIETVSIIQPTEVMVAVDNTNDASCSGNSDGEITVSVSGGGGSYNYSWSHDPGLNAPTATGLIAGTYTVVVSDVNNCSSSVDVTLTQPVSLDIMSSSTDVACNGDATGTATITPMGGTTPYSYQWPVGSGQSGDTGSNMTAGTYAVTVSDANMCAEVVNIVIDQPTEVMVSESHVDVACNGDANGELTITATGGTAPYTYSLNGAAAVNTPNFNGLTAGTYTIVITDDNSCSETVNITIDQPTEVMASSSDTDATCNGVSDGSTTITASGGTPPYAYSLNGGAAVPNATFNSLAAGSYTVVVTDNNNCSETVNLTIDQPTEVTATSSETDATCNSVSNGETTITPSGGTPPYTYSLNGAAAVTNPTFSGLAAGNYTVVVSDNNNCSETVNLTIDQPSDVMASSSEINASCNGASDGETTITASGGTAPYTYSLNGGAPTMNATFTGLAAGNYTVVVSDNNNCNETVNLMIDQPSDVMATSTDTDADCNGASTGQTLITASGGTPPYTYSLNGAAPVNTPTFGGLAAGSYTVVVTDNNNCSETVNLTIDQPTDVMATSSETDATCNGVSDGSTTITASGGTAPYTYSLNGGAAVLTPTFNGLAAGSYTVVISDNNNCSETVNLTIDQPTDVMATSSETDATCNGGSDGETTITASGGTSPYTYSLNGGTAVTNPTFNGLAAGNYTVVVLDNNNC
ncbi:MAG: hypothetical protein AAGG75_22000, partial [Bacteroidota bacterium]